MRKVFYLIIVSFFLFNDLMSEVNYKMIEDLSGLWRFNIGDNSRWNSINFDDSNWDVIYVPSRWESEGYNGYDGYAWYRKNFKVNSKYFDQNLYLSLGVVDDVAEIYINEFLVGVSGSFPPQYESAYNAKIWLPLPKNILKENSDNIISVRVYDKLGEGGIYKGDVGIYISQSPLNLITNFEGRWKFKIGDDLEWRNSDFNDSNWKELLVPSMWDNQGYKDYDGFAWYRLKFKFNKSKDIDNDLIVILGKIDDLDECYLNDKMIGSTGDLIIKPLTNDFKDGSNIEYMQIRGYRINKNDLKNGENLLAVRVYDGFQIGGIYEGPVGITTLKEYVAFRTNDKRVNGKSFIELLFD